MSKLLSTLWSEDGDKLFEFDPAEVASVSYDSGGFFKRPTFRIDMKDGSFCSIKGMSFETYQTILYQIKEAATQVRAMETPRRHPVAYDSQATSDLPYLRKGR